MTTIDPGYAYPLMVGVLGVINVAFCTMYVGFGRQKYKVMPPKQYLPEDHVHAMEYNSIQRAHQNVMENFAPFITMLICGSPIRPRLAAAFGFARVVAFFIYFIGYISGDPKNRLVGFQFGFFGLIGLLILSLEAIIRIWLGI